MTCKACGDWGLKLVVYEDGRQVYAVCLCSVGERWRIVPAPRRFKEPSFPLWRIWAFQHGVFADHVLMLEDAVTPEELASYGFRELSAPDALGAIASAARQRKVSR